MKMALHILSSLPRHEGCERLSKIKRSRGKLAPTNGACATFALFNREGYSRFVAAHSATGRRGPINNRRTGATISIAGAFFVPVSLMAAVRGRPSGLPGSYCPGPRTCAQLPPLFVSRRTVAAPQQ